MAKYLTRDEKSDIIAQFSQALDQNTRDLAALAIRQKYENSKDVEKKLQVSGLINSIESLYRLCPRGAELGVALVRATDTRRYYKIFAACRALNGRFEVATITGYILDLDIGKEAKGGGSYVLSTTSDANAITMLLSHTLYGNSYALTYRTL